MSGLSIPSTSNASSIIFPFNVPLNEADNRLQPTPVKPSNYMEKIVHWLRNDQNPLFLRVGAVALALIGTLGVALLVAADIAILGGYSFLVCASVLVPTAFALMGAATFIASKRLAEGVRAAQEEAKIKEAEIIASSTEFARHALDCIKEAVGGEEAFNRLPILDLGTRTSPSGLLDFLTPNDLREPVMKGTDAAGRHFIALRLQVPGSNHPFVIAFFQRYPLGVDSRWEWGTNDRGATRTDEFRETFGLYPLIPPGPWPIRLGPYYRAGDGHGTMSPLDSAAIRQIVVGGNRPQLFRLV